MDETQPAVCGLWPMALDFTNQNDTSTDQNPKSKTTSDRSYRGFLVLLSSLNSVIEKENLLATGIYLAGKESRDGPPGSARIGKMVWAS